MAPSEAEARSHSTAGAGARRWRGTAFGLQLQADFFARGVFEEDAGDTDHAAEPTARTCALEIVSGAALEARWPHEEARLLRDLRDRAQRRLLTIAEHPAGGYRLHAPGYGRYLIAADGGRIVCAPSETSDWEWQAFVIGQVLPLAAVLQGLEAVHASAVAVGDHVIGLVADSRGGKSSLAVNLVRQGCAFVADDVLALERAGDRIIVHPGAALASVRHAEADAIGPSAVRRLGCLVGRDDHELRVAVQRESRPLPLAALYFIEHSDSTPASVVRELEAEPRLLLGNTFNGFVRTPSRLISQLDLYAQLARTVPTFAASVSPAMNAYELAGRVRAHALDVFETVP